MQRGKEYECEIRFILGNDLESLRERLKSLNSKVIKKYKFTDHILKPENKPFKSWTGKYRILRVREWTRPLRISELIYTRTREVKWKGLTFKKTIYPEGKIVMYRGPQSRTLRLAKDLGFEKYYSIVKKWGILLRLEKLGEVVAIEEVEGLGLSLEVEVWGSKIEEVHSRMSLIVENLNLKLEEATSKPIPILFAERFRML